MQNIAFSKGTNVKLKNMTKKELFDFGVYLFFLFIIGCFVGWFYEEIFYWITEGMLRNRGIMYGPWLPIYGTGAIVLYMAKPLKKWPPVLFFTCLIATGIVEYVIGSCALYIFKLRLWDYRGLFLSDPQGMVCFRSTVSFAVLGVLFHYLIEPLAQKLYKKLPKKAVYITAAIILGIFVIDIVLSALMRTPITYPD